MKRGASGRARPPGRRPLRTSSVGGRAFARAPTGRGQPPPDATCSTGRRRAASPLRRLDHPVVPGLHEHGLGRNSRDLLDDQRRTGEKTARIATAGLGRCRGSENPEGQRERIGQPGGELDRRQSWSTPPNGTSSGSRGSIAVGRPSRVMRRATSQSTSARTAAKSGGSALPSTVAREARAAADRRLAPRSGGRCLRPGSTR